MTEVSIFRCAAIVLMSSNVSVFMILKPYVIVKLLRCRDNAMKNATVREAEPVA